MTRISLCMIVRDEAEFIEGCLASVRDAVDEMIVVDTGSTDTTPELARQAGAQVFFFPWCDDFAAARNASLSHATGDWVLWLDADERLAPGAAEAIRAAVTRDFDFGYLPMHNATRLDASPDDVVSGKARAGEPFMLPKLLRRTPDLQFQGVVHENLSDWIARHPRAMVLATGAAHYGYVPEVRRAREKDARNLRLLETRIQQEPDNPVAYGFLAQEQLYFGELEKAWESVEAGWAAAEANPDAVAYSLRLALIRAQLQMRNGDYEDALRTVVRAEQRVAPHPDLHLFGGAALISLALQSTQPSERRARLEGAMEAYQAALDLGDQLFMERNLGRPTDQMAKVGLGTAALLLGEPELALSYLDSALESDPGNREMRLARAEALIWDARAAEALAAVEPLLGEAPDPWLVGAEAAEALGAFDDAALFVARARELARFRAYASPYRSANQASLEHRLAVYQGELTAGPGAVGAACAVLVGEPLRRPPERLQAWEQIQVVLFLKNLARIGRLDLLRRLIEPDAEAQLPGVAVLALAVAPELQDQLEVEAAAESQVG